MQWLTLLLLVPAVLVPVVLMFGFAGCAQLAGIDDPGPDSPPSKPAAPSGLNVEGISESKISISWQNNAPDCSTFLVQRTPGGPPFSVMGTFMTTDQNLPEGSTFSYTVSATRGTGPTDTSDPSPARKATTFPAAPSGVIATPTGTNEMNIAFTNHSSTANLFAIHDVNVSDGGFVDGGGALAAANPQSTTRSVVEGTAHTFTITVTVPGFRNDVLMPIPSTPSAPVTAQPLAFKVAMTAEEPGLDGTTIVQRINAANLKNSGSQVRITVRGPATGNLILDKVTISQPATVGDRWDSAAAPVVVKTNVKLAANTSQALGFVAFPLNRTQDILIAFDINVETDPTISSGQVPKTALSGAEAYTLATQPGEAGIPNRSDGAYETVPDTVYLIEKIEVI